MSSQQQQQTNLKTGAPQKFTGSPTASMLKGLYNGPKALKTFGAIKGAKAGMKSMPKKGKTIMPSKEKVQRSIRKTMGY